MADLTLTEESFTIIGMDGTHYEMADPLQFMLDLASDNLIGPDGRVSVGTSDALGNIRSKIVAATGIPALTATQVLRVIVALGRFCEDLQKKIASPPNSSQPTGLSPNTPPNA